MSSTTPNIGLTKTTAAETIGQNWAASNDSGGNFDIIDTKIGPVGGTSLQAQISPLPRIAVINWEPTGADASVTAGTAVTIATVTDVIPSGAIARGVIKYSAYGASNYDYDGSLMLVSGSVKYMPKITQGSIHVYGAIIYTV